MAGWRREGDGCVSSSNPHCLSAPNPPSHTSVLSPLCPEYCRQVPHILFCIFCGLVASLIFIYVELAPGDCLMNAEEGYCERRREWAVPRGLSVVYCWEAGTARTGLSWKKINVWKNKHTPVHTNTHFCIKTCINTNKKLATEHKEKESICM